MIMPNTWISKGIKSKGFEKTMGLAASQARFLGLTARKANCEFKSSALAEEKLSLSNQLSQISSQYSNAMNATKFIWQSDVVQGEYDFSYGVLMTPTALNDYNPYMVTSQSGAIVLDSFYAAAARAAGIGMGGGVPSQAGRDKFIEALAGSDYITMETAKKITIEPSAASDGADGTLIVDEEIDSQYIKWDPRAGLGAEVVDKNAVDGMNISDVMASESMGQKEIDWAGIFASMYSSLSMQEYNEGLQRYATDVNKLEAFKFLYPERNSTNNEYTMISQSDYNQKINDYEQDIQNCENRIAVQENIVATSTDQAQIDAANIAIAEFEAEKNQLNLKMGALEAVYGDYCSSTLSGAFHFGSELSLNGFSMVKDNSVVGSIADLENMVNADLISNDYVLVYGKPAQNNDESDEAYKARVAKAKNDYISTVLKIMKSVFEDFGLGDTKHLTGLNVDQVSHEALEYAYTMIKNVFLKPSNIVSENDWINRLGHFNIEFTVSQDPNKDAAVKLATDSNRVAEDPQFMAVNLSNVMSAFLTYYDNYIANSNGSSSNFVVSKTVDKSKYVTESTLYTFYGRSNDEVITLEEKIADFYDELYNNICARGWRYDDTISDNEYLEASIRNGRYNLSALHDDGYFYQTNYAKLGDYLVEVTDDDAITRAEAEYTRKKAEITFKENAIDIKSKQMDAEIAELNAEVESVKKLISDGAKIFNIFQGS